MERVESRIFDVKSLTNQTCGSSSKLDFYIRSVTATVASTVDQQGARGNSATVGQRQRTKNEEARAKGFGVS